MSGFSNPDIQGIRLSQEGILAISRLSLSRSRFLQAFEDLASDEDLWEAMMQLFSCSREQRIAYLLFHCGLKTRKIVQVSPDEFSQIEEVYRLRHALVDRLLRHADLLSYCVGEDD